MCEFCVSHGEGKKWYEVMSNYTQELWERDNRQEFIKNLYPRLRRGVVYLEMLGTVKRRLPPVYRFVNSMVTRRLKREHFGQIVPREDAETIIDMARSVTRLPCVCREALTGAPNARYCFALGFDPAGILGDYPE